METQCGVFFFSRFRILCASWMWSQERHGAIMTPRSLSKGWELRFLLPIESLNEGEVVCAFFFYTSKALGSTAPTTPTLLATSFWFCTRIIRLSFMPARFTSFSFPSFLFFFFVLAPLYFFKKSKRSAARSFSSCQTQSVCLKNVKHWKNMLSILWHMYCRRYRNSPIINEHFGSVCVCVCYLTGSDKITLRI